VIQQSEEHQPRKVTASKATISGRDRGVPATTRDSFHAIFQWRALRHGSERSIWLLASLMLTTGCDLGKTPRNWDRYRSQIEMLAAHHKPPDLRAESQQRGRAVYRHYCKICHGEQGGGDGFNSAMLEPPPRNFTDDAFWKQATDKELTNVITRGGRAAGKSRLMPSWGHTLDEAQIQDVIAYLRTIPQEVRKAAAAAAEENATN